MKKNTLQDLRDHLFEQLEELRDPEKPLDVERARAVCNVADKIIGTGLAEVRFLQVTGRDKPISEEFFSKEEHKPPLALSNGGRRNGGTL